MAHFVILTFAVFFIFIWVSKHLPLWLKPVTVLALCAVLEIASPRLLEIIAAAGATGVLYAALELN